MFYSIWQRPAQISSWPGLKSSPNKTQYSKQFQRSVNPITTGIFLLDRDPFVGREKLMNCLGERFKRTKRLALHGLGGVGKTTIAAEFGHRLHQEGGVDHRIGIGAESRTILIEDIVELAKKMGMTTMEQSDERMMLKWVHGWLDDSSHGRWIVVIDSADDLEKDDLKAVLKCCIPRSDHGRVLLTTRSEKSGVRFTSRDRCIEVDVMAPDDAASLLLHSLTPRQRMVTSQEDAMNLVQALGYLPLAIYHASAYLACSFFETPSSYLEYFLSTEAGAEARLSWEDLTEEKGSLTPLRTFEKSFQQIESQNADSAHLLYLIGCLDARRIELSEIQQGLSNVELDQRLRLLKSFCLITLNTDGKSFTVHRLVQLAIRYTSNNNGMRFGLQLEALRLIKGQFEALQAERAKRNIEGKKLHRCTQLELIRHFEIFYQYANTFQRPGWIPSLDEEDLSAVSLFARLMHGVGKSAEAENIQRLVVNTKQPSSATRAESLRDLAVTIQGRVESPSDDRLIEASRCCREAERFAPFAEGITSFELKIKSTRATIYSKRHDFERALELQKEVCEQSKASAESTEHDIISFMSKLAMIHYEMGIVKPERAKEHIRKALDLQLQVVQARERFTCIGQTSQYQGRRLFINAQANVMRSHLALGNLQEAAPLAKTVVSERLKLVGPDDRLTLDAEQDLAAVYRLQGLLDEAEMMERDVLERRVARWGLSHHDVLHSAEMLYLTLSKQGKFKDARDLIVRYKISGMEENVSKEPEESVTSYLDTSGPILASTQNRETMEGDIEFAPETWGWQRICWPM